MNRIALKVLALLILTIAAFGTGAPAAEASHDSATYTGKSSTGADVTLTVNGNTVVFTVANDPCGQGGSGQAAINGNHAFGGGGNPMLGGIFNGPGVAEGWYMFPACREQVHWTARKFCDCEDTRVFATWYNVGGRFDNNRIDIRHVKLHLVVDCVEGQGSDCSGSASASVSGATAVPAKINLSCTAKDLCPEQMEAAKIVKIKRRVGRGAGTVTITVKHGCTGGPQETTTLTLAYNARGWPVRGASDLNGDGQPDRIS
jgi:hypothetical protein